MTTPVPFDAIVLGAGGAGMMCAGIAGQRGKRVLLIDHNAEPGRKILISGGGRCNFTNIHAASDRYISANPHFAKSALSRYSPADFLTLVERHGIAWHEKTLGQLFCDDSARQIVAMLESECAAGGVEMLLGHPLGEIGHANGKFSVTVGNRSFCAPALVIATGGPSIPKLGATAFAYDLARRFGLKVIEPRPALVPLTLGGEDVMLRELSGVSADVVARTGTTAFREAALLTHRGLSGPAILQISSYWKPGSAIALNFLPDLDSAALLLTAKRDTPKATLASVLARHLPARLAELLAARIALSGNLADQSDKALRMAGEQLSNWNFMPNGTEGFAKAEVTSGGIATAGLSSQTMAARHLPGLYCIGEAVDVTGWLGGYNFQWAWASGFAAGQAV